MRRAIPIFLAAIWLAPAAYAQDFNSRAALDGSAPGKILLVLRDLPPGKPAMIVREPPSSNFRQRSILFFSPKGTPEELALALVAFDRIRREDGEVIKESKTVDYIGTAASKTGKIKKADSLGKLTRDMNLREMQSILELLQAQPEKELRGLGHVRWVQVSRPPMPST